MTLSEEPPVVEIEELLDDQQEQSSSHTAGQIALIVGLSVVGLVAVSILATMLIPVITGLLQWVTNLIRVANGA